MEIGAKVEVVKQEDMCRDRFTQCRSRRMISRPKYGVQTML